MPSYKLLAEIFCAVWLIFHPTRGSGSTDDIGMIAYFNSSCPEGWSQYTDLTGRVVVGIGSYTGTREDGANDDKIFTLGETGGEINHNLSVPEMPTHNHRNGDYKYLVQKGFNTIVDTGNVDNSANEIDYVTGYIINDNGGSQEHNNMPPYFVLYPCIKQYSIDNFTEYNDFLTTIEYLENEINSIKSSLTTMNPTQAPTIIPSDDTLDPTVIPSLNPSLLPSLVPTTIPTDIPVNLFYHLLIAFLIAIRL